MPCTVIDLPTPPSTNHLYCNVPGRGRVPSKEYLAWRTEAGWMLKAQRPKPVHGAVELSFAFRENNRRDLSNHLKAAEDLLVEHKLIDGDRCKTVRKITLEWADVEGVKVTITVASA